MSKRGILVPNTGTFRSYTVYTKALDSTTMKIRINVFLFLIYICCCLCFTACGEERFEGVVYDLIVPPAEVQTELPPEVWEAVKIHAPRSAFGGSIFEDANAKLLEDFTTDCGRG